MICIIEHFLSGMTSLRDTGYEIRTAQGDIEVNDE
jgi:hypothetical protein